MRAIWITRHGGPQVLEVQEASDPSPAEGEIRIRVAAAGLNFSDILARLGFYPAAPKPPCVMGYEVSGTVDRIGAGVEGVAEGDRVVAMTRHGGQADIVCVPARCAVKLPDEISFETAAALPVNYLTAAHMARRVAGVRPGDTILVHAAAGGVGQALLQICQIIGGVRVIGTASASKHDMLRQNGCAEAIDYRTKDYVREARRLTGDKGVDVVFDCLGGADWKRGYRLLRSGGRLVAYGFANVQSGETRRLLPALAQLARMPRFSPLRLMTDNKSVSGVTISDMWGEPLLQDLAETVRLCQQGKLRPRVDSTFSFARAVDAHRRIQTRQNAGKVILAP
jgi:synaptic vesicle membrane protein VAT-1